MWLAGDHTGGRTAHDCSDEGQGVYMYIYIYMIALMRAKVAREGPSQHMHMHTHAHACIHMHMHACMHACMHTRMHTCTCMHTCIPRMVEGREGGAPICMHICTCMHTYARMVADRERRAPMHAYMYMYAHMHTTHGCRSRETSAYACIHVCVYAYIPHAWLQIVREERHMAAVTIEAAERRMLARAAARRQRRAILTVQV